MTSLGTIKAGWLLAAALACASADARAEGRKRDCVPMQEIHEVIAAHGLIRPVIALRAASVQLGGEAVGAKLCRWGLTFVYEIALLQKDGRVIHGFINAATGDKEILSNAR